MIFGRRHRKGHAKQMAYIVERPERQAARAQALIAKRPPREVPPSPPPLPKNQMQVWEYQRRKAFVPKMVLTGPDTFGLMHQRSANENRSAFHDGYTFCKRLEKKGWKLLGKGCHSQVLAKDGSNKVIKVGCTGDNWMRYVLWGRQHGYEGNFVPKVYSYKYFKGDSRPYSPGDKRPFYVAVVERMKEQSRKGAEHRDPVLLDLFHNCKNIHAQAAMNMLAPGCGDFANNLRKAANDNDWSMDIHGGNFMVRENGSWVATDPINSHGDTPTERIRAA